MKPAGIRSLAGLSLASKGYLEFNNSNPRFISREVGVFICPNA